MATVTETLNYDAAIEYLFGRINYERSARLPYRSRGLKLDRMRELARRMGDPHLAYPVIHVAGTKGKGSTSSMIASILSAAGLRTGLYTSPHLDCMEERLRIDGRLCSQAQFVESLLAVRLVAEQMDREAFATGDDGPTFFEIVTAMAMHHFQRQQVDAAVLEVGLGGRLDSTNICQPAVSVITSIHFDHMRELGPTLESIAREKAGIIKSGQPVVCGVTNPGPLAVIREIAEQRNAPLHLLGRDFHAQYLGNSRMEFRDGKNANAAEFEIGLIGRHQANNAALALATVGQLREQGWQIGDDAIARGLRDVRCGGRAEVFAGRPPVVVDVAHNEASIEALLDVLEEHFRTANHRTLVFAATRGKDIHAMLKRLLPRFDRIVLTRYIENPRAVEPSDLALCVHDVTSGGEARPVAIEIVPNPIDAWKRVTSGGEPTDLICIAGSFFLAAELRNVVAARNAE